MQLLIMYYTTETFANELNEFLNTTKYFLDFTHYNSYYQVRYSIPKIFTELSTPQWAHIKNMVALNESYLVTIAIFEDSAFIKEYALKHSALTVK